MIEVKNTDSGQQEILGKLEAAKDAVLMHQAVKAAKQVEAQELLEMFGTLLLRLRQAKPEERNETARRYAVTITDFEKVLAYYKVFIVNA